MRVWLAAFWLITATSLAHAKSGVITVYQDPNCGCCSGWVDYMRDAGFMVKAVKTADMASVKRRLGVPMSLASCHTGVSETTGQLVEGHVPENVVRKLLADASVKGVSAPGMPLNAPGMGALDGNLITVDFNGKPFSRD
ncbi:DUF411 domain-containing protein [Parapusillimonas sp. JC17]|uniref:DUF411 domain-containing protein n=1 Tax=Parapusillimonas sp. JC17 TaxID=3445768 RepID=UPI003F9F1749